MDVLNADNNSQSAAAAYGALAKMLAVTPAKTLAPIGGATLTAPPQIPPDARALLVHEEHMTLKLRAHCGCPVALHVMSERREAGIYAREILLRRADDQRAVEYGIVRIHERFLPPRAVAEIHARSTPLGDILIANDILRRIEPRWFFRFEAGSIPAEALGGSPVFGRLGVIHCDNQPAIEVLEVVMTP